MSTVSKTFARTDLVVISDTNDMLSICRNSNLNDVLLPTKSLTYHPIGTFLCWTVVDSVVGTNGPNLTTRGSLNRGWCSHSVPDWGPCFMSTVSKAKSMTDLIIVSDTHNMSASICYCWCVQFFCFGLTCFGLFGSGVRFRLCRILACFCCDSFGGRCCCRRCSLNRSVFFCFGPSLIGKCLSCRLCRFSWFGLSIVLCLGFCFCCCAYSLVVVHPWCHTLVIYLLSLLKGF